MSVEQLTIVREVAPNFYRDGVELLRTLREEQRCPVCQTGTIVRAPGYSRFPRRYLQIRVGD